MHFCCYVSGLFGAPGLDGLNGLGGPKGLPGTPGMDPSTQHKPFFLNNILKLGKMKATC